jgi:hypothetical protein
MYDRLISTVDQGFPQINKKYYLLTETLAKYRNKEIGGRNTNGQWTHT